MFSITEINHRSVVSPPHVIPFFQTVRLRGNNQIIHGSNRSIPPPPTVFCHFAVSRCELCDTHTHPDPPVLSSNGVYGFVSRGWHFMLNPGWWKSCAQKLIQKWLFQFVCIWKPLFLSVPNDKPHTFYCFFSHLIYFQIGLQLIWPPQSLWSHYQSVDCRHPLWMTNPPNRYSSVHDKTMQKCLLLPLVLSLIERGSFKKLLC